MAEPGSWDAGGFAPGGRRVSSLWLSDRRWRSDARICESSSPDVLGPLTNADLPAMSGQVISVVEVEGKYILSSRYGLAMG